MANKGNPSKWLDEIRRKISRQPNTTWTVAKMKLSYPSPNQTTTLVSCDNVSAMGSCSATATSATFNETTQRVEVEATFSAFELRGESHIIGPFKILLQNEQRAVGRFRQRYATQLWPLQGEWQVPFRLVCSLGELIPRPTDNPVTLRSAEPGEFDIPPLGAWFEKWDPISLVDVKDPEGLTLAIVEHAMHCMINTGSRPKLPPFWQRAGKL